jgi:hypothetical protein
MITLYVTKWLEESHTGLVAGFTTGSKYFFQSGDIPPPPQP